MPSPTVYHLRAKLAVATRDDTGEQDALREQLKAAVESDKLDRAIALLVASAPKLNNEQADRLRGLLPPVA